MIHSVELYTREAKTAACYLALALAVFVSTIPTYELWVSALRPTSVLESVPVLALALAVQTLSWLFLLLILQLATFGCSRQQTSPWSHSLYVVFHSATCAIQRWSFLSILWGSPAFNYIAKGLGARYKGRVLCLGYIIYDFPYITFSDRTIVDEALITGHFGIYGNITLGPTLVSGILHQGSFAMANAIMSEKETCPRRGSVNNRFTRASSSPGTEILDNVDSHLKEIFVDDPKD